MREFEKIGTFVQTVFIGDILAGGRDLGERLRQNHVAAYRSSRTLGDAPPARSAETAPQSTS